MCADGDNMPGLSHRPMTGRRALATLIVHPFVMVFAASSDSLVGSAGRRQC